MPEMHLKPGFTYSGCGLFTKNKERIEKFLQTRNADFIYRNELDKAFFQDRMAYGKSKDLIKRTQSDKIASDPKYDGYQRGLASMFINFLIKSLKEVVLLMTQIINYQMNLINQLLENKKKKSLFII